MEKLESVIREKPKIKLSAELIWKVIHEYFQSHQERFKERELFIKLYLHPILENKDIKEIPYFYPPHPCSWEKKHHFVLINGESVESMAGIPALGLDERY